MTPKFEAAAKKAILAIWDIRNSDLGRKEDGDYSLLSLEASKKVDQLLEQLATEYNCTVNELNEAIQIVLDRYRD